MQTKITTGENDRSRWSLTAVPIAIVFFGYVLRVWHLTSFSVCCDELNSLSFATRSLGDLLSALAWLAIERGCGRLEWAVLNWNEPAIRFYQSLGAVPMDQWTSYRLTGVALAAVAGGSPCS